MILKKLHYIPDYIKRKTKASLTFKSIKYRMALKPDEWGFICPYGVGDIYLVAALAHHFLQKKEARKIVFALRKEQIFILNLFSKIYSRIIILSDEDICNVKGVLKKKGGRVFIAHPNHQGNLKLFLRQMSGGCTLLDIYKKFLSISESAELAKPYIDHSLSVKAEKRLTDLNLPLGKTVILAPIMHSMLYDLPLAFWRKRYRRNCSLDVSAG